MNMHLDQALSSFFISHDLLPGFVVALCSIFGNIKIHLIAFLLLTLIPKLKEKSRISDPELILFQLGCLFSLLYILKITFLRVRPEFYGIENSGLSLAQRLFDNKFHSFPSSHSALIGFYLFRVKNFKVWIFPAILMGLSRVVTLQHYPTDVFAGYLCGLSATCLTKSAYDFLYEKIKKGQKIFAPKR